MSLLEANAGPTGIALGQIYYGPALSINYNDPTVDPRTPDIIVTPNVGVTYSGSTAKLAEHGGFAHDDTNVILLLSNAGFKPATVREGVGIAYRWRRQFCTRWVINPSNLQAVKSGRKGRGFYRRCSSRQV